MGRRGTIFTYSIVHSGTETFKDKTPYVVALVEEGERIRLARIEGYTEKTEIRVGMEVELPADDGAGTPLCRFMEG